MAGSGLVRTLPVVVVAMVMVAMMAACGGENPRVAPVQESPAATATVMAPTAMATQPLPAAPPSVLAGVQYGTNLERSKPELARAIIELPWVADGFDDLEHAAAEALVAMGRWEPDVLEAVLQRDWVNDSVSKPEVLALTNLRRLGSYREPAALRILDMEFFDSIEPAIPHPYPLRQTKLACCHCEPVLDAGVGNLVAVAMVICRRVFNLNEICHVPRQARDDPSTGSG